MNGNSGTADSPFRVGLIGYGLAGSVFHAPLIDSTPGLVLDTVVTSDPERRHQARAAYPDTRVVTEADALWTRADPVDLVVVAAPNRTHVALAGAALRAGRSVVVDKPLAPTAAEGRELAALAAERGTLLSVFHNRRWDSDFRTLRTLLRDDALGEVWRFESRYQRWRPTLKGGWRESGDPADVGGLLYDLGSHLVDQALTLFGPVTRVYAESDVRRPAAAVDDDTFLALTHASGVRSHLWASSTAAHLGPRFTVLGSRAGYVKYGMDPQEAALREGHRPVPVTGGIPGSVPDQPATAAGDRVWGAEPETAWGRLTVGQSTLTGDGEPVPSLPGDYPGYYAGVEAALRHGGSPPVTAAEAVEVLAVLEAARCSAVEGRVVPLGTR